MANRDYEFQQDSSQDMDLISINIPLSQANNSNKFENEKIENMINSLGDNSNNQNVQNEGSYTSYDLNKASHPFACLATFIFKALTILIYFGYSLYFSGSVNLFLAVTLINVIDFWTVKNITGRLLVGLRYWSDFDENEEEIWYFESYDSKVQLNPVDVAFFWTSQISAVIFWSLIVFVDVLGFKLYWSVLSIMTLSLYSVNLYGFYKCSKDHQKKITDLKTMGVNMVTQSFLQQAFKQFSK